MARRRPGTARWLLLATLAAACAAPGQAPFDDVTDAAGLGSAVNDYDAALADYDGDGRIDVYLTNHGAAAALLRNLGAGRFEDVTARVGLPRDGDQHGAGWGDADGDGRPDLYVALGARHGTVAKANPLHRFDGTRFRSDTRAAPDPDGRARAVSWVDVDRDGHLDLFVANLGTPNALFRNRGDGTFEERAAPAGLARPPTRRATWTDVDRDGWPDVLFAATRGGLRLYRNRGDGTFADVTAQSGLPRWPPAIGAAFADADGDGDLDLALTTGIDAPIALTLRDGTLRFTGLPPGGAAAVMLEGAPTDVRLGQRDDPVAHDDPALDFREHGPRRWELRWRGPHRLDGYVANGVLAAELVGVTPWRARAPHRLFLNRGDGTFTASDALDVGPRGNGQAVVWGDVDADGDVDLAVVHSGVEGADEPDLLLRNDGRAAFTVGGAIPPGIDRHAGAHLADLDGDGRLDLLLGGGWGTTFARAPARLFRNVGPAGHWLALRLVGRRSNRFGLGSWIDVDAGGRRQVRYHAGGTLYGQDLVPVHVGLGDATAARITVTWPSGAVATADVAADRVVDVVEPAS